MDYLSLIKHKIILEQNELKNSLAFWRFKEQKLVFTNGCFDILHRGHIEYLAQAASYGNIFIIGLNSDESVKRLKGNNRPLQDQQTRAMVLASLTFVDQVVLFNDDTPFNLIKFIQPDILIKGGDYEVEKIVGYDIVKAKGGDVFTINFVEGFSTTKIIDKMNYS